MGAMEDMYADAIDVTKSTMLCDDAYARGYKYGYQDAIADVEALIEKLKGESHE